VNSDSKAQSLSCYHQQSASYIVDYKTAISRHISTRHVEMHPKATNTIFISVYAP